MTVIVNKLTNESFRKASAVVKFLIIGIHRRIRVNKKKIFSTGQTIIQLNKERLSVGSWTELALIKLHVRFADKKTTPMPPKHASQSLPMINHPTIILQPQTATHTSTQIHSLTLMPTNYASGVFGTHQNMRVCA